MARKITNKLHIIFPYHSLCCQSPLGLSDIDFK